MAELSIKDAVALLVGGDDGAFEPLMKAICAEHILTAVRPSEEDGAAQAIDFLSYTLDDMDYIPLFTDREELDEFYKENEAEGEYKVLELDGHFFANLMQEEQFLMINPAAGGIMFQGGHLKPFIEPAKLT